MLDNKSIDSLLATPEPGVSFTCADAATQLAAALALNEAAGRELVRVNARCAELAAANASLVRERDRVMEITRLSEDRTQLKAALTRIADPTCDNRQELARLTLAWLENKHEAHPV